MVVGDKKKKKLIHFYAAKITECHTITLQKELRTFEWSVILLHFNKVKENKLGFIVKNTVHRSLHNIHQHSCFGMRSGVNGPLRDVAAAYSICANIQQKSRRAENIILLGE